jgi:transmembrane sensor
MDVTDRRERAAQEAAEWSVVLQGEPSLEQREQYIDWLRESPLHVAEMLGMSRIHGALERFPEWARFPATAVQEPNTVVTLRPATTADRDVPTRLSALRRPGFRLVGVAAAMLVIVLVTVLALVATPRGHVIQTDRGERREVALEDGSIVQIDPQTRLRVVYDHSVRRIVLERGRALFRVAKRADRPFSVEVRRTTVLAIGTAFAVDRSEDGVVVTVAEGRVAVLCVKNTPAEHPVSGVVPPPAAVLTANQQLVVPQSGAAAPVRVVDSGRALAWAQGRLIFDNQPVADAVAQFNRYNRIQIHINDVDLARRPVSGVFNAENPESFVAFIQSVTSAHVVRSEGGDLTVDSGGGE